jgi:hypothetical protein
MAAGCQNKRMKIMRLPLARLGIGIGICIEVAIGIGIDLAAEKNPA